MGIVMLDNKVLMSGNQMALYIPPETWYLNEYVSGPKASYEVDFVSGRQKFFRFTVGEEFSVDDSNVTTSHTLYFEGREDDGSTFRIIVTSNAGWISTTFRTITLSTPATGKFLIWLQANAVKQ